MPCISDAFAPDETEFPRIVLIRYDFCARPGCTAASAGRIPGADATSSFAGQRSSARDGRIASRRCVERAAIAGAASQTCLPRASQRWSASLRAGIRIARPPSGRQDDRCPPQLIVQKRKARLSAGLRQTLPSLENLERAKGLEPSTPTLARSGLRASSINAVKR